MRYKCAIDDSTDSYPNYIQLLHDTAVKRFQIGMKDEPFLKKIPLFRGVDDFRKFLENLEIGPIGHISR